MIKPRDDKGAWRTMFNRATVAEGNEAFFRMLLVQAREIIAAEAENATELPANIRHFLQRSEQALNDIPDIREHPRYIDD